MSITEYLKFDVARFLNILLNNYVLIIERLKSFSLGSFKLVVEFLLMSNDSHTFASTTKRCLDNDWETDLFAFR
jgi:hypothetical protein